MNVAQDKRRRDWSIIIFILPLGVVMMMCVGQLAIRMSPSWSVSGDMNSSLDPENAPKQNVLVIPPISSDILTPVTWWDTFLTPMSGEEGSGVVVFPPFITFEPSATPSATASTSATPATTTLTTTSTVTGTPPPPSKTPTKKPTDDDTPTVIATTGTPTTTTTVTTTVTTTTTTTATSTPTTCTDPLATNNGGPLPCTYPPTTCTDPLATNNGGPLPCTYPPTTCTDPLANNNGGPLPCVYPVTSTPVGTLVSPPVGAGTNTPPDGVVGNINNNSYIVLNVAVNVSSVPDGNYDLAFYESPFGTGIQIDWVSIGISNQSDGSQYYEVFNWGSGTAPDMNSNVGDVAVAAGSEGDNYDIDASELHDPDGGGPSPQTGILIDVDTASSNPPAGTYNYVVVISPPGGSTDPAQVDAVVATEVPIPTP